MSTVYSLGLLLLLYGMILDMMKYYVVTLLLFPSITLAQTGTTGSLQSLLVGIGGFLNNIIIPFLLAIAFIVFIVNVVRFFIIESTTDEGKKNAKNLAIYGVGAFVFILSFWGITNLLVKGLGFDTEPCIDNMMSDYITNNRQTSPCTTRSIDNNPNNIPGTNNTPGKPGLNPIININPNRNIFNPSINPTEAKAEVILKAKAEVARNETLFQQLFNQYQLAIKNDLFQGLTQQISELSDRQLAVELRRAAAIGLVSNSVANEYFSAMLAERIAQGELQPITRADIERDLPVPLPNTIVTSIQQVQSDIIAALLPYQAQADAGFVPPLVINNRTVTPSEVVTYLYNQNIPVTERQSYFEFLVGGPREIIDASRGDVLYDQYLSSNNTVAIYAGHFEMIRRATGL
jgi:hypothetical protein